MKDEKGASDFPSKRPANCPCPNIGLVWLISPLARRRLSPRRLPLPLSFLSFSQFQAGPRGLFSLLAAAAFGDIRVGVSRGSPVGEGEGGLQGTFFLLLLLSFTFIYLFSLCIVFPELSVIFPVHLFATTNK